MKLNKAIIILVIPLLLLQPFIFVTLSGKTENVTINYNDYQPLSKKSPEYEVLSPGAGDEDELKTNVVRDGSFSGENEYNEPVNMDVSGSAYVQLIPNYSDDVYSGLYSYLISCKATVSNGDALSSKNIGNTTARAYLDEDITLDFKFKINNPEISSGGNVYFYVSFDNGTEYRLYYYLSSNNIPVNTTNHYYVDHNMTLGSWTSFSRDISADIYNVFGDPGSDVYVSILRFFVESPAHPSAATQIILDEIRVFNSTNYQFITKNWNFEDYSGSEWSEYYNGPGLCSVTNADFTEGDSALNLTSWGFYSDGQSSVTAQYNLALEEDPLKSYYPNNQDDLEIAFDWKYTDETATGSQQSARFYFTALSESKYYFTQFSLGDEEDLFSYTNSSFGSLVYTYIKADGFGSRDTWQHFSLDVHDLYEQLGISGVPLVNLAFSTTAYWDENAITTLLVDDFKVETYPTGDPSFESDMFWSSTNTIPSWFTNSLDEYQANLTTDKHTGLFAANLTTDALSGIIAYRTMELEVSENLYTDFWWKINNMSSTSSSYTMISLVLNNESNIYYILGGSSGYNPINTSDSCYYLIDDYNTTGLWSNLVRNVQEDIDNAFIGSDWNITAVLLASYSTTGLVSTLFDDIHFVKDTTGPTINSVSLQNTPNYYEDAIIDIQAVDAFVTVDEVYLYYQNDSIWYSVLAADIGGDTYRATIPMEEYGVQYRYYINATDSYGNIAIDDNAGMYYIYTIGDDIAPTISITNPINNTVVSEIITIAVDVTDDGSGVHYVDFLDGWSIIEQDDSAPYTIQWDTRTVTNGIHEINCVVYDNAGNTNEEKILVDCQNDFDGPNITNIQLTPSVPIYDSNVQVDVEVEDENTILNVELHYKIDEGSWVTETMVNLGSTVYRYWIPEQPFNTKVYYYFTSEDSFGQNSSLGTAVSPNYYLVDDTVLPVVSVIGPDTGEVLKEEAIFEIDAFDVGSGIQSFAVLINNEEVYNSSSVPETFTWNTKDFTDDEHSIIFAVRDNAGNVRQIEYIYSIDNLPIVTIITVSTIGGALLVASAIAIPILRKRRLA